MFQGLRVWTLALLALIGAPGCGVDGPVLFTPGGQDGGADASMIPDATADASAPFCQWEVEEVASVLLDAPTSLALDSTGAPQVAYYAVDGPRATQGWLGYARRVAGVWQRSEVEGGPGLYGWVGLHPSLALDDQDRPRIAYRDASNDVLKLASWDGAVWQLGVVAPQGARPSLALDSLGLARVGYTAHDPSTGRSELRLASWDGFAWQLETLVSDGDIRHVSLSLDGTGFPHLAYYDSLAPHLGYALWDGFGWHFEVVDDDGVVGAGCRLVLDDGDRPHVSYLDVTGQRLKHATRAGMTWQVDLVVDTGRPGAAALRLGTEGQPIVAYHGMQPDALGLARFDGNAWLLELVEEASPGGKHLDLALGPAGEVHVSFGGSGGGGALRYASCVAP